MGDSVNAKKESIFTLKTAQGCKRLLALLIAIILASSFAAALVASNGAKVNIANITFDARGGTLNGELYTPVGTSSRDSLPAVILMHGGGCTYGINSGTAQELARRGFVVFNMSSYGAGLSQQPPYDEKGYGVEEFSSASPQGVYDALEYIRTLKYVDKTRIGLSGHSMGSTRVSETGALDVSYLTLNDIMINVLCDTFGLSFTKDEISREADLLAAEALAAEQLEFYNYIKNIETEKFNNMVKAILPFGGNGDALLTPRTVQVAGHDVIRNAQTNVCILRGAYDGGYAFAQGELGQTAWMTGGVEIQSDMWYSIQNPASNSAQIGDLFGTSIATSTQLSQAIESRSARLLCINKEDHSQNFFSKQTTADIVKFFEQTLDNNNGRLSDNSAQPIDAKNCIWFVREYLNLVAMLAMIAMLIPLTCYLVQTSFFKECTVVPAVSGVSIKSKTYWVASIVMVIGNFVAMYYGCNNRVIAFRFLKQSKFFPLDPTASAILLYLVILAAFALAVVIFSVFVAKKTTGTNRLGALKLNIPVKTIGKTALLAATLFVLAYSSLAVIKYLFLQDYRFWMAIFTELKVEHWVQVLRYAILILPLYLLLGSATNFTRLSDLSQRLDTILTVVMGSLGVYIVVILNQIITTSASNTSYQVWTNMLVSYGLLILVPATVYLTRKMHNITGSVWLGAFVNALFIGWAWVSSISSTWVYMGSSLVERLLGF